MQPATDPDADGGFNLIELLVVIVVLGIIVAFTIVTVRGASHDGNESGRPESRALTAMASYSAQPGGDIEAELLGGEYRPR